MGSGGSKRAGGLLDHLVRGLLGKDFFCAVAFAINRAEANHGPHN